MTNCISFSAMMDFYCVFTNVPSVFLLMNLSITSNMYLILFVFVTLNISVDKVLFIQLAFFTQEQLKKRVTSLENLLAEERHKVAALEKKLTLTGSETLSSAMSDDVKLHMREKELLLSEVSKMARKHIEDIQVFGMNMPFISSSEAKNAYFMSGEATNEIYIFSLHEMK